MRVLGVPIWIALLAVAPLAAGTGVQTEGEPVPLQGLWRASLSGTTVAADGTARKFKVKADLSIADYGSASVGVGPFFLPDGDLFPAMSGTRLAHSFSAEAEGVTLAATVKRSAQTGEATSFKGTGIFSSQGEVTVFKMSGKRLAGVLAPAQLPLFLEDFEGGLGPYVETNLAGAAANTLWHAEGFCAAGTAIPASLGTTAAAYNRGDEPTPNYTYNTGGTNSGALQGPAVAAPSDAPGLSASFDILRQTEVGSAFDQCFFQARETECGSWASLVQVTSEVGCGGTPITVTIAGNAVLDAMVGKSFLHRFQFDTDDPVSNNFLGWYVDNVRIEVVGPEQVGPPPSQPTPPPRRAPGREGAWVPFPGEENPMGGEGARISTSPPSAPALTEVPGAQAEGEPVLLEGLWETRYSGTTQHADGTVTKFGATGNLPIADYGTASVYVGWVRLTTGVGLPGMPGGRYARSFTSKAERFTVAATVKKDAQTGEGISFKGTGILQRPEGISVLKIRGKKLVGIPAPAQIPLHLEAFDIGLGPYTETTSAGAPADTLWHWERFCAPGIPVPEPFFAAAAYNQGDLDPPLYHYETGPANSGALQGPAVAAPSGAAGLLVTFDILRDVERAGQATFDRSFFEVSPAECISWTNLLQVTSEVGCSGTPITITIQGSPGLDAMVGKSFLHRFRFDTIDGAVNDYIGWYVDNVRIETSSP